MTPRRTERSGRVRDHDVASHWHVQRPVLGGERPQRDAGIVDDRPYDVFVLFRDPAPLERGRIAVADRLARAAA